MKTVRLHNTGTREEKSTAYDKYIADNKSSPAYADSKMCQVCIAKYKEHYLNGELTHELDEEEYELRKEKGTLPAEIFFPVSCTGDLRHGLGDISKAVTDEEFAAAGLFNPDVWFKEELGIELRWYQSESASCTARAKVDRWGRRCLPASEKILLEDMTEISIKDIEIGTKVIGTEESSIYKTTGVIVDKWEDGIKPIFKIILKNKKQIRCTSNHPIMIMSKDSGDWLWSTIEDGLIIGDQVMVLANTYKGSYSCEQIISIEPDGEEPVYDITVDDCHNFIVNTIITHNTGKTHHKVGGLLQKMQLGRGLDERGRIKPEIVLIVAPYQPQIDEIFTKIDEMLSGSRTLKNMVTTRRRSPNQVLQFANGSRAIGFCIGADTGNGADKTKGQDATLIYSDEIELMTDDDVDSFMAIMGSKKDSEMWATSTPTGRRGKFYSLCTRKDLGFKETHLTAMESPEWTETTERILRLNSTRAAWEHNYLAEFGTVEGGVFNTAMLEAGLSEYQYGKHLLKDNCITTIGVDWNGPTHGNPIVVLSYYPTENCYTVVDKYVSANKDYTQLTAIQDIIRMYDKWKPNYMYFDAGFGSTNFEILRKYANTEEHKGMLNKMKSIQMQGNAEIRDPITKQLIKKQNKALMIDLAVQRVESNMCYFPYSENVAGNLVDQMRNFKIERYTPNGLPVYSQGKDHELIAWALAMYAITMEYSDLAKMDGRATICYLPPAAGSRDINGAFSLQTQELIKQRDEAARYTLHYKEPPSNGDIQLNKGFAKRDNSFSRTAGRKMPSRMTGKRGF